MPLTKGWGILSHIHCHVIHFTFDYTHKLILWEFLLEMQSTKYTFFRCRLIVLYKYLRNSSLFIIIIIIGFKKISSFIPKNGRSYNLKSFYLTCLYCNLAHNILRLIFFIDMQCLSLHCLLFHQFYP